MRWGDWQWCGEQDRRAIRKAAIEQARRTLADVDVLLMRSRLRRREAMRIVFKEKADALIMPPNKLRYRVTDNSRYRR